MSILLSAKLQIFMRTALLLAILNAVACTNSGFTGSNKPTPTESKKTTPQPTSQQPTQQPPSQGSDAQPQQPQPSDNGSSNYIPVAQPKPNDNVTPPAVYNPPVKQPVTNNPVNNLPDQNIQSAGTMAFNAIVITNMENGQHTVDYGTMAVLRDAQSKRVIAAGDLTLASAINGGAGTVNGQAYPVSQLKVTLSHIDVNAPANGTALLSLCPVSEASQSAGTFACEGPQQSARSSNRPVFWYDKSVQYSRTGQDILINNPAGGNGEQMAYAVSFAPPLAFGPVGGTVDQYPEASSPLVLDLNGNSQFELSSVHDPKISVRFDLENIGVASRVGWISGGDALLVLDVNNNGVIDNGSELFGEHSATINPAKSSSFRTFKNGFDALAQYDSNGDGKIDAKDRIFSQLQVWVDSNRNGVSEKTELQSLSAANVKAIGLKFTATGEAFATQRVNDNEVRYVGYFWRNDGTRREVADVWFGKAGAKSIVQAH